MELYDGCFEWIVQKVGDKRFPKPKLSWKEVGF
jgi:hypothetical protein